MDKREKEEAQEAWIKERKIDTHWWRCSKCLERVWVKHGLNIEWECQPCKLPCEEERRNRRLAKLEQTMCVECSGQGWVSDMIGDNWVRCFCQTQMQAPDANYGLDDNYSTANYATSYQMY
jgi:hypothetical protein